MFFHFSFLLKECFTELENFKLANYFFSTFWKCYFNIFFITSIGYNKRRDYFEMLCIMLTTVDEKTILLGSELGIKFCCSGAAEFEVTCVLFFTTMSNTGIKSEWKFSITLERKWMWSNAGFCSLIFSLIILRSDT